MTLQTSSHKAPTETIEALGNEQGASLSAVQAAVPVFTPVPWYTTFTAEYAMIDGDIVLHFFAPTDLPNKAGWKNTFADALVSVAPDYFQATAPRLVASYTEEMKSWWVRARGYDHLLDIDGYLQKFFTLLDAAIDAK